MPGLAQAADGLHPTEDLFHSFALDLTDGVPRMASGAAVDGAVNFASDVRSDLISAQVTHQFLLVVALIAAQRDSMLAGDLCRHREGRLGFCAAGGLGQPGVNHQAVAIVHLHVPGVTELGLFARTFAGQPCLGIGSRSVSGVGAPLTMKVHARVAGIIGWSLMVVSFALETLVSGPGLDQRAIDGKMLVREQALSARLIEHRVEKALRYLSHQQTLAILGEDRHIPHRVVDVEPHKPAKQEVVIELLHQKSLAAHRVKHLQEQRTQKLFRRDRRPPAGGVDRVETPRRILKRDVYHDPDGSQRMIFGYSPLRRYVAEHSALLMVHPAHHRHLRLQPLPTSLYPTERKTPRFSAALYVDELVQESELVVRQ